MPIIALVVAVARWVGLVVLVSVAILRLCLHLIYGLPLTVSIGVVFSTIVGLFRLSGLLGVLISPLFMIVAVVLWGLSNLGAWLWLCAVCFPSSVGLCIHTHGLCIRADAGE